VPRHVARLVTRLIAPLVDDYSSSSTTSSSPRVRVPRHVARLVMRLVAPLVVIDHSVRRNFVSRPRWLYFSHAVRGDYLPRGNTGSTSSMPHATTTSSSSVASRRPFISTSLEN
jgi:hypothetical protein